MALNLEVVGKSIKARPFRYGPDQVILYALGIGAGPGEIEFIYEKGLKVYPTFAVAPFLPAFLGFCSTSTSGCAALASATASSAG